MKATQYRVGKRVSQDRWQIKEGPGWRVVFECYTLEQAAEWCRSHALWLSEIPVLQPGCRWPSLAECVRASANPSETSETSEKK